MCNPVPLMLMEHPLRVFEMTVGGVQCSYKSIGGSRGQSSKFILVNWCRSFFEGLVQSSVLIHIDFSTALVMSKFQIQWTLRCDCFGINIVV
jgi:hypothetical protein